MHRIPRILLTAFIALGCSSLASADATTSPANLSPDTFSDQMGANLDDEFESRFGAKTAEKAKSSLASHSGPTTMKCDATSPVDGIETCVVTAVTTIAAVPAAMSNE